MITLIMLILFVLYFVTGTHRKFMNHLGLTERDDKLMFIGFLVPSVISSVAGLISSIIAGAGLAAILVNLAFGGLAAAFIYFNYRQL